MGLPIPASVIKAFRRFCANTLRRKHEPGYFNLTHFPEFDRRQPNHHPLWEFHAANYNPDDTYDILELFESVSDQYTVEQHQYDEFWVDRVPGYKTPRIKRPKMIPA